MELKATVGKKYSNDLNNYDSYEELIGYVNAENVWVIEPQFRNGKDFSEGLAFVVTNDNVPKYQYIDEDGKVKIDLTNHNISFGGPFNHGLALVKQAKTELWALVGKDGKLYTDFVFKSVGDSNISKLKTLCWLIYSEGAKVLNWADPELLVSDQSVKIIKKAIRNHIITNMAYKDATTKEIKEYSLEQKQIMERVRENKLLNIVPEYRGKQADMIDNLLK